MQTTTADGVPIGWEFIDPTKPANGTDRCTRLAELTPGTAGRTPTRRAWPRTPSGPPTTTRARVAPWVRVNEMGRDGAFGGVVVDSGCTNELAGFVSSSRPDLERALVARFGLHDGMEAAAVAVDYAVRHWARLGEMENPAGYLYRVGESSARRADQRRRRHQPLVTEPVTIDRPLDVDLQRALTRLRPDQRVALVLVYAHGHSYAAAARLMNLPVTTVNNHLTRGLARLRKELEP
jgi:RNA polymerase sigma-70 factor (ECF subfamily)